MFSSSNNVNNPFPHFPSSSPPAASFHAPFPDAEAAVAAGFFPFAGGHHHDPLFSGGFYAPPAAGNFHNAAGQVFEFGGAKTEIKDQDNIVKKAARKDRHSKISTSQGLRDRRVRLSIGISREFFDLQDMLGFDTASKTLEWLLGKSKKDIRELEDQIKIRSKHRSSSCSNSDHDESNEDQEDGVPSEKKVKKSQKDLVAREIRAKARERARERTKEKLFTQLGSHNQNIGSSSNAHRQQHFIREDGFFIQRKIMMSNQVESAKGFVDWDISNAIRRSTICVAASNLSTELQMYGKP